MSASTASSWLTTRSVLQRPGVPGEQQAHLPGVGFVRLAVGSSPE
ncbi:MAG: hypothetical protein ACLT2T_03850 [Bilophila wadsworthia]